MRNFGLLVEEGQELKDGASQDVKLEKYAAVSWTQKTKEVDFKSKF